MDEAALKGRWESLCARVGAFKQVEESELTFDMLRTLYGHPVRAYHNLEHIGQVLGVFDSVRVLAEDRDCVEFALWLHDCVYFAERPDNEERSADAAAMIAGLLGCPAEFVGRVRSLIAVTRHSVPPARGDWALIADIDLTVLGAERAEYDAYRRAIRSEFAFADDAAYADGRRAFLNRMLEREHVYHTAFFRRELEGRARENMWWELDELGGGEGTEARRY